MVPQGTGHRGVRLPVDQARLDEAVTHPGGLHIRVGEDHRVIGRRREPERPPQPVGALPRHPRPLGHLRPGVLAHPAQQQLLKAHAAPRAIRRPAHAQLHT